MNQTVHDCPLCGAPTSLYCTDRRRAYYHCTSCGLVHVPGPWHLDAQAERAIYDLHENDANEPGYRRFLSRVAEPLLARLPPASEGLDFGCGPAPALAAMLEEHGHCVALHDIYYHPAPELLDRMWDFITATEVVEHLAQPLRELDRLWDCLQPGGWLAIMTKRVRDQHAFRTWHYKNDLTHISFFSEQSFEWLAKRWSAELAIVSADVVLLRKGLDEAGVSLARD